MAVSTHHPDSERRPAARVVLITGASSGIGRATARLLAARGYTVFGTSRHPDQAAFTDEAFPLLPLDVTSDASAGLCVAEVIGRAGRLDVLINNAGVDLTGALEESSMDDTHYIFETNYFGAVRMVNTALPYLRASASGQIVNVSSALGRAAWPFNGQYCASKFALEGYTEALCYEMNLFGIRVSSVEPGFFATGIFGRTRQAAAMPEYADARAHAERLNTTWVAAALPPDPVARTIARILESPRPRLRYPVGPEAHLAPPIAALAPLAARLKVGRWLLGVDDPRADGVRYAKGAGIAAGVAALTAVLLRRRG